LTKEETVKPFYKNHGTNDINDD